ncbi:MAG: pyrroline-5-carboxylate reductase [Dehalococcoidia bacterium]|nr:pyrroline-5-carboxylate reductase [Dehalococcoidia bacterium]
MLNSLAVIGGGVMGEAILKRLIAAGLVEARQVRVAEVVPGRREFLQATYGVSAAAEPAIAAAGAETVVVAVKPQNLAEALSDLKGRLTPDQLLLSIVAGATISAISLGTSHEAVVRVMPNTPAQIGQGMSVWTAAPAVTDAQKANARALLGALGREIYVSAEHYLDMATAVSGSGPAYVFLVLEALIDAGVHIGLPRDMAGLLALQTLQGSAIYAAETGAHPAHLRNLVTSPGGTTAAALLELEAGALRAVFTKAVAAAYHRAQELGRAETH